MKPYEITSHEAFSHDSIDSLGYDWERVANPNIAPKYPLKVYFPRETEHIVRAVKETQQFEQKLWVRSKGHSSNDLVLTADGAVLCTEKLNRIMSIEPEKGIAQVQSGVVLAHLDAELAKQGMGLPVIGDHNHITAGGFASVGGISPGSHRYGLFIDNILELKYVDWEGGLRTCSPKQNRDEFFHILAGTGRFGVIATLTLRIIEIRKRDVILRNDRFMTRQLDNYIKESQRRIEDPEATLYERGVWLDLPIFGSTITIGQFSSYRRTSSNWWSRFRRNLAYGYLHFLGRIAGRLPRLLDIIVKYLGIIGIVFSPRYGNISDVESFTDKVIDSTVADPTRMLVVLAPVDKYSMLFRVIHDICKEYREKHECFTFISFYVKAIKSEYLKPANGTGKYSELMLYLGLRPERMTEPLLNEVVSKIDDLCVANGALRYMHTKTVKDEARRKKVDPNSLY
jgi:hypothetical protein